MDEFARNLSGYVQAVIAHMLTILAGCAATVILELYRRFYLKRDFPDRWYIWILMCFLCFASFQAWQDQSTSRVALEGALSTAKRDLEKTKPGFKLHLEDVRLGGAGTPEGKPTGKTFILITTSLTNTSQPSVADHW